jgi:hypothetical protein
MAMVRVLRQMSAIATRARPVRVPADVAWRTPRVAEGLTQTLTVPMTARMAVRATPVKRPPEFVVVSSPILIAIVMARRTVTMGAQTIRTNRAEAFVDVVWMSPRAPIRGAVQGIPLLESVDVAVDPTSVAPAAPGVDG